MSVTLTVPEVCEATGGSLVCGDVDTLFTAMTIDSRAVPPGALFVPLPGSRTDGHAYLAEAVRQGAGGFLFSPQVVATPPTNAAGIAIADPLTALQDLAAWYRKQSQAVVIGVAGSNGKTTTKELLAQVCAPQRRTSATQGNLNNHIGVPLTLLRTDRNVQCLVLELGTSGAGELATLCQIARPTVGVITSIAEEHTETLKDLNGVIAAETELIAALPPDGVAIVNGDHEALLEVVHRLARCRVVTFGEHPTNKYRVSNINVARTGTSFTVTTPEGSQAVQVNLLGSPFALAGAAAIAVAAECGFNVDAACAALRGAHGAARRMAVVEVPAQRLAILDDCYNANPASMRQAILTAHQVRAPGERLLLVLGDMLELGELSLQRHREIGELIATLHPQPDLVVTVGEDAHFIAAATARAGIKTQQFAKSDAASTFLRATIREHQEPQLVLVKGSRGIHLEEVTRSLAEM